MLATLPHFLVGILGLALLYCALFLHETEGGQLQNRLEKLWIDIDDLSKAALSKQTAFLQRVSAMAKSALNKLFGARLFSAGVISASLCFSLGSALLLLLAVGDLLGLVITQNTKSYALVVGIVSFLVGLLPVPFRYLGFAWVVGFVSLMLHSERWSQFRFLTEEVLPVFFGGLLSDVLFIALSRWCLQKCSELKNGWKIASLLTVNGCVGLALISPLILQISLNIEVFRHQDSQFVVVYRPSIFLGASNGISGVMSLLFVVLALVALTHSLVWPLLNRPLYSLQRFGVARNPKLLAAASVTCLLFAWPHSPLIFGITKLLHLG